MWAYDKQCQEFKAIKVINYDGGSRYLCSRNWVRQIAINDEIRLPSSMMKEDLSLKTLWFLSSQTIHMIALTTQSHWLTTLCEILESLQLPQSDAMKDGQEERVKRLLYGTQSSKVKGQWRKICLVASGSTPQSKHRDVVWLLFLTRLSTIKRHSCKESHMYTLTSNWVCVIQIHRKQLVSSGSLVRLL